LFSVSSFSAQTSTGASGVDISGYASSIISSIISNGGGVFNRYKGKGCVVGLHLSRDGSFSFSIEGGHPDLCKQLSGVLNSMKNLPPPPSDAVYQKVKHVHLDFKP
ncbi:cell envelope integrity protein TolA, partial [Salmonella enterica subsp. enterica serovar Newport]|nr:cell envelope integrity protein TolA [Salmonella enterica subsp. enterica serovar Newport]